MNGFGPVKLQGPERDQQGTKLRPEGCRQGTKSYNAPKARRSETRSGFEPATNRLTATHFWIKADNAS
jgi:hypothetical protein